MRVRELRVEAFRNLQTDTLPFHARTTVLAGDNGEGKTNVLEALYLLAGLRSFRTARLAECIAFGEDEARVHGRVDRAGRSTTIEVRLRSGGRRVLVDDQPLRSAREYRGDLNAIVFVPEDLGLARGSPDARRRFVDRGVFATAPAHLADLLDYERALRGRNILLKEGVVGPRLEAQSEVLANLGAALLSRRRAWALALAPLLAETFAEVGMPAFTPELRYESRTVVAQGELARPALAAALLAAFEQNRSVDLARGFTTAGPHADDLELVLDGHPLRVAGSQGQQRAFVLALKLAEIRHASGLRGEPPILLLDDVGSELDETRRAALFSYLDRCDEGLRPQVIVTTTTTALLPALGEHLAYDVRAGRCAPRGSA